MDQNIPETANFTDLGDCLKCALNDAIILVYKSVKSNVKGLNVSVEWGPTLAGYSNMHFFFTSWPRQVKS